MLIRNSKRCATRCAVFAEKEIYPVSENWDRMPEPRKFPIELYRKIGQAGFIGYAMPKEYGGSGKSHLEYITLIEELCYHDAAIGLLCAVAELATSPIINFGHEEQKKKYVPDCASGKRVPAFVLTEPEAGSDAANQKTVAAENGDHYHRQRREDFHHARRRRRPGGSVLQDRR